MKANNNKKEYKMNIGENIRMWRTFKGIEPKELASRINKSVATISNIENGIAIPNIHMLEDIANALEIEVVQLMSNPQQFFTFNNSPNSNGVYGTQNQYNVDKTLIEKFTSVMEKMTDYFTSSKKPN
jgi:transcriptional regulator with XRE-family HTH domain